MKKLLCSVFVLLSCAARTQSNWTVAGDTAMTLDAAYPFLRTDPNGILYGVYLNRVGYTGVTVKKLVDNHWKVVGDQNISKGDADCTTLAFDSKGIAYVAYTDNTVNRKATVMKFDGTNWVAVGQAGFTPSLATVPFIAFDSKDVPHVVFRDFAYDARASVMKFEGGQWTYLGNPGFSALWGCCSGAMWTTLTFDKNDIPFVAYADATLELKPSVQKFDGSNWIYVGSPGFADDWNASYTKSLAFDSHNNPYVVCVKSGRGVVMKFNGSEWKTITNQPFSTLGAGFADLLIDQYDRIFIAYSDESKSGRAAVKMLRDTTWISVGADNPSGSMVFYTTLAMDNNNVLYLGYMDSKNYPGVNPHAHRGMVLKYQTEAIKVDTESETNNTLSVFPNPSPGKFSLSCSACDNTYDLVIHDQLGRKVFSQQINFTENKTVGFELNHKGVFFISLKNEKEFYLKKVIVE